VTANPIAARFGQRVAAERRNRGLTLAALAAQAGVTPGRVSELEAGLRGCRLDTAVLLASVLGISLDGLAGPAGAEPQQRGENRDAG
jgi:transcriptional regulator with XRE-family HTH domain